MTGAICSIFPCVVVSEGGKVSGDRKESEPEMMPHRERESIRKYMTHKLMGRAEWENGQGEEKVSNN